MRNIGLYSEGVRTHGYFKITVISPSTVCLKMISNLVGPGPHYSDLRYVKPGPKINITWHSRGEL